MTDSPTTDSATLHSEHEHGHPDDPEHPPATRTRTPIRTARVTTSRAATPSTTSTTTRTTAARRTVTCTAPSTTDRPTAG